MTQRRVFDPARLLVSTVLGVLLFAGPTYADPITLNFFSEVDFSSIGGESSNTLEGSITWDPASAPFDSEPGFVHYDPVSYTLFFNGADVSAPVIGDGTGSGISITNDGDPLGFGEPVDMFAFFLAFPAPFPLPNDADELVMIGVLAGPTSMFNSDALPGDLGFLNQVSATGTLWMTGQEEFLDPVGSLEVSADAVPEPAALALLGLGLAALARQRQARRARATRL
jgi:hypothetical protein